MYRKAVKRALGVFFAALLLILTSPLMLAMTVLIRLESRGPAIFRQERIGKDGKVFIIYKFRSMKQNSEHTGSGVYSGKGDARVTRLGKFLRATSIDELPQLVNILRGDMSFIGPRPPLTYHPWPLEQYSAEQRRMFEVRPGMTGWAQINGRRCVEWNNRIEMNVWYVDHLSFLLDAKILLRTIICVFTRVDNENVGETVKQS